MRVETPIYEIRSLTHLYAGKPVLDINHLQISDSSIVGIVGPNGSGKSTLLRLLGLIERPSSGEIYFKGRPAEPFSNDARLHITMLPQDPILMKRSVSGNVSFGLKLRGNRDDLEGRVNQALEMIGLDAGQAGDDFSMRPWYALSGGEIQRVALAARLALRPKVLLLDEPTANVDAVSAQMIKEAAIKARKEWGTTLIIASHDWQWLHEICDNILHMFRGKVFGSGRENIIFGPWRKFEDGAWGKMLADNQQIRVPEPPDKGSAAIIDAFSVSEDESNRGHDNICLSGTVLHLSLDKGTGHVFVTLAVGIHTFTISMTDQQIQAQGIYPGKSLRVHYRPDRIKWV